PLLLDLLASIAEWTRDAPLLLLVTSRPELLEVRPTWGGGMVNATTVLLEPLASDTGRQLVETLLGDQAAPADLVEQVLEVSGGNPLFAGEIVRMLRDEGRFGDGAGTGATDGTGGTVGAGGTAGPEHWRDLRLPTSVQAVVAARLDRLPTAERIV